MKYFKDKATITLYFALLALFIMPSAVNAAARFAVFTDPHYYDSDLGTTGTAFEAYLQQDRKLIRESDAILESAVEQIINEHNTRPVDFVIVPGDLTKDGELASHEKFASYLAQLEDAGIPVFVVPGNHDINNPHAFAYNEDGSVTPVDNVSPEKFISIYWPYGYNQALSRDSESLSYAAEPVPGIILLGLDSCRYEDNLTAGHPETAGSFSAETLEWATRQIKKASLRGKQVIAFLHHGLLEHYQGQKTAFPDYVIDDWETVSEKLAASGLELAFTGHYHANDITMKEWDESESRLYDIETGSLVTAPCPYRIVTLHGKNAAQVVTRTIKNIDYDTGGVPFPEYAGEYLYSGLLGIAKYTLTAEYQLDEGTASYLAPFVADAFAAHYAGDENPDQGTMDLIEGFLADPDPTSQLLGQTLYSLWNDLPPSDNRALIMLNPSIELSLAGTYESGFFDEGAAEITAFDPETKRFFVSNANLNTIDVLNGDDPSNPVLEYIINMDQYGGGVNSVAVKNRVLAAAVEAEPKQDPGKVVFFDTRNFRYLNQVTAGALPDMLTFTPDGRTVLVANEGEPNDDYTIDPEGSVTIIDISGGVRRPRVKTATFTHFNNKKDSLIAAGVRIFGPGASVAQDLEPEYITVDSGSPFAWISLQENNAIACLNILTGRIITIQPLGYKDHSLPGNGIDASNKDDRINIETYDHLFGMYLPDAIEAYRSKGNLYIVTANEGDSRDYDGYSEEKRVADLTLDPDVFPDAEYLQDKSVLGRLNITTSMGDSDGDGKYEKLFAYGGRSFSIFKPAPKGMELVFDSGDMLEQITAAVLPYDFNSNNTENDSFDSRSDDKGPEPEGLTLGRIGDRTYLFLGLERVGGIMVFDITNPGSPDFVQYINNRDFLGDPENGTAGDLGPEGLIFIPAAKSPNGKNLLAVANEVSGSTSIYNIDVFKKHNTGFKKCGWHPRRYLNIKPFPFFNMFMRH